MTWKQQPALKNFKFKKMCNGICMANDLSHFFVKIDPPIERNLTFKRQGVNMNLS